MRITPNDRVLVVACHTDDEIACAGTVCRFAEIGATIHYYAASIVETLDAMVAERLAEIRESIAIMGCREERALWDSIPVRLFDMKRQTILDRLIELRERWQPTIVFGPSSFCFHQDHVVIHSELLRAFRTISVYGYETPWSDNGFKPSTFVTLSQGQLSKKIAVMEAYRSQSFRHYMIADAVSALSRLRGILCGSEYAEAFECIRDVV